MMDGFDLCICRDKLRLQQSLNQGFLLLPFLSLKYQSLAKGSRWHWSC
jgi:hypothetical protein